MSTAHISRFVLRHKLPVVLFWVAMTVVGVIAAGLASSALSTRFDLPGRESTEVNTAIAERYGNGGFATPYVAVVELPVGTTVDSPGIAGEIDAVFAKVAEAAPETRVVSYASTGDRAFVSEDGATTFGLIYPRFASDGASPDEPAVTAALDGATIAGADVSITGLADPEESEEESGSGVLIETLIGAGGSLIVLLWVFGSFLALLPLAIAAVSIFTCFLLVWGLTAFTDVSFIIQFLIALIGLGVAIDYSLLVVTRWREERAAGRDNAEAVQRAMETAGHSVVFSGTTVAISLLALVALPVPFLRSVGFGGMLIPLVSMAVSITLLPVILATFGRRLDWPRWRSGDQVSHIWERWAKAVVQRRGIAVVMGLAIMIALTIPVFSLQLASPVTARFDAGRIRQVATILLDNAVKHTAEGGAVTVAVRQTGDHVELAVSDTGSGIEARHVPHIFERFYRIDTARTTGGAGLGLAIAQQIAGQHGGAIGVVSTAGRGSTFTLTLPVDQASMDARSATPAKRDERGGRAPSVATPREPPR